MATNQTTQITPKATAKSALFRLSIERKGGDVLWHFDLNPEPLKLFKTTASFNCRRWGVEVYAPPCSSSLPAEEREKNQIIIQNLGWEHSEFDTAGEPFIFYNLGGKTTHTANLSLFRIKKLVDTGKLTIKQPKTEIFPIEAYQNAANYLKEKYLKLAGINADFSYSLEVNLKTNL